MNFTFHHKNATGVHTVAVSQNECDPLADQENPEGHFHPNNSPNRLKAKRAPLEPSTTTLPPDFKPREAKNMPLSEKISIWLANVPWTQLGDNTWVSECYPGHTSSAGFSDDMKSTADDQDIFEHQARQITKMIRANYLNDNESSARPLSHSHDFATHKHDDEYYYGYAPVELDAQSDMLRSDLA